MPNLLIVGPGRVGTALALALQNAHHSIIAAVGTGRQSPSGLRFENLVGEPVYDSTQPELVQRALEHTEMVLFSVQDCNIGPLATQFASQFHFARRQMVCHTAGAVGLDVLQPIAVAGPKVGCLHPLQTFVDPVASASQISNTHFAVSGDTQVKAVLMQIVHDMGATGFYLHDEDRIRYHAGAALASNALVALIDTAVSLLPQEAGLEALFPLIEGTMENLRHAGLPDALTGPIERGDISTVRAHIGALSTNSNAKSVYQTLGRVAVHLASAKGKLNEQTKTRLLQILHDET